jgi:DNA-binding PadR family transcriptional regulator
MNKDRFLVGQLDLLLLAVLARDPAHGYAIIERLRARSGDAFDFPEGTVYPALYRLERGGFVRSDESLVAGRKRRTYRLTPAGTAMLRNRTESWREFVVAVESVLRATPARGNA